MSFASILESIVQQGRGIVGAALIESDGIPIEQVHARGRTVDPLRGDLGLASVEFSRILADVAKASDAIGGGAVGELVAQLARVTLVLARVEDEIVLVVALAPDGNVGQARYLIRRSLMTIRQEL